MHAAANPLGRSARPAQSKLRVCILCPGGTEAAGGIGRFVGNLMSAVASRHPHVEMRFVDTRGSYHIAFSPLFFSWALLRLLAVGLTGRVSIIHVNVASRGSTVRKFFVVATATALGVPVVLHLHAAIFEDFYSGLPGVARGLVRWMFQRASCVVVLGSAARTLVVQELGVASDRVEVISNGVPSPAELPGPAECAAPPERITCGPLVVFLGRLCERKGVDHLIAALAAPCVHRHGWRAALAGDGDQEPYLAQAARLGIADRLTFPGWLDQGGVSSLLRQGSIFVLPSHAEGLPMAVIEALAHGVAVVATPVGALPDHLVDGQSVLLVSPGDEDALASALDRLMGDESLRRRIGQAGQEVFRREFDIASVADRFSAIYGRVAGGLGGSEQGRYRDRQVANHAV